MCSIRELVVVQGKSECLRLRHHEMGHDVLDNLIHYGKSCVPSKMTGKCQNMQIVQRPKPEIVIWCFPRSNSHWLWSLAWVCSERQIPFPFPSVTSGVTPIRMIILYLYYCRTTGPGTVQTRNILEPLRAECMRKPNKRNHSFPFHSWELFFLA